VKEGRLPSRSFSEGWQPDQLKLFENHPCSIKQVFCAGNRTGKACLPAGRGRSDLGRSVAKPTNRWVLENFVNTKFCSITSSPTERSEGGAIAKPKL